LVVFDAKTGVRLWDATLSGAGVEKIAESVADGVLTAQRKQTVVGLPTICLMSVRNADLPRSLDTFCDSIGLLLERRLTASPGCVVLERGRLDQINKERELPGNAGQQQLLASLVMLELECNRGPDGKGMSASARLTDNKGKLLDDFSVTNQNANADELAVALYQKISGVMNFKSGQADEDRVKESNRFWQTAGFVMSHGDLEHGLQDLEAAFALNPDNLDLQRQLAVTLIGYARAQTNLLNDLRIADRGSEMFVGYTRKSYGSFNSTNWWTPSFAFYFPEWSGYFGSFNADAFNDPNLSPSEITEARQLLQTLYARFRAFREELSLPALAESVLHHPNDSKHDARQLFQNYVYDMIAELDSTKNISALYPEDYSQEWLANFKGFLNLIDQLSLERQWAENGQIGNGLGFLLNTPPLPSVWEKVKPAERKEALLLMAGHSSPLVRDTWKLTQLNADREEAGQKNESLPPVDHSFRIYLQDCLNDPAQNTNFIACRMYYGAAGNIGGAEMVKFCDFMLQRNDLHPGIINQTASYLLLQTNRESAAQAVDYYDRAVALLKQPDVRFFGGDTNQYLQDLAKQRVIAQNKCDGITEPLPPPLASLPPAWSKVSELINLAGTTKGLTRVLRPVVQGNFVYAAGFGTDEADGGQFLQLLRIPLKGGAFEVLGRISVTNIIISPRVTRVACADENNYYFAISQGVFIFPKAGGTVEVLNQNNGLPSDDVTALDSLDGKLYVGLGDSGYLVSYDLKTRHFETLCSARRQEQLSPFDNGSPLSIPILMADESKHRIVFLTDQGGGGGNLANDLQTAKKLNEDVFPLICAKARAGMWSYYPASHEFKCILPRWPNAESYDITWLGRMSGTQIAMVCNLRGMALFDFTTDEHTLLYGACVAIGLWYGVEQTLQRHGMVVNPAFHCPPQMGSLVIQDDTASLVHDGWIWSAGHAGNGWVGNTFSRVSMDTGRRDELPPLRVGDNHFEPGECFRLIGSDQALIGDQRGLWLVDFADYNAETKTVVR
jgi:hypothetical protein